MNKKQIAGICIGVVVIFVIVLAIFGGSGSQSNDSTADHYEGYQVKIITDGSWSGSVGTDGSQSTYEGTGDKTIDLGKDGNIVSAAIQKKSGGTLKVQILKDGKVIKEESTEAQYGVVTVASS